MIWVAKNLYFFNCLLDGAHTIYGVTAPFLYLNEKAGSEEPAIHGIINYD